MGEKITFASWDYIKLLCFEHKIDLSLAVSGYKPVYRCKTDGCNLCFSADVYEKVLDDVVKKQNTDRLIVGDMWKKRIMGSTYAFTVEACPCGKQVEVSVEKI